MLKEVEKIDNILNDFLKEFECEASLDTDFAYYHNKNLITYSLVCGNAFDELFSNVINLLCPYVRCDLFIWSLLHEVGHNQTLDDISDEDYRYCQDEKERIQNELSHVTRAENEKLYNRIANEYFFLPDEIAATMWAVDYVTKNTTKIKTLWQKLQVAIMEFYRVNNVEV